MEENEIVSEVVGTPMPEAMENLSSTEEVMEVSPEIEESVAAPLDEEVVA